MAELRFNRISPELLTPDHVRGLSLHDITDQYGTHGLTVRLIDELDRTGLDEQPEVTWALWFGMTLHANDTRTVGHYKDHILRVTLRPLLHYGVIDPTITAGSLLHDSVEDHAFDIVRTLTGTNEKDEKLARERALELIAAYTTAEVAEIVSVVTNPILDENQDRLVAYYEHTRDVIVPSQKGRVIKLSDFTDNAVGNHYTHATKRERLDRKYRDLYRLHAIGLFQPDSLITGERRDTALRQLHEGHSRTLARLSVTTSVVKDALRS